MARRARSPDDDGRPFKRQRADAPSPSTSPPSAAKLSLPSSPCPIRVDTRQLKPLPPATLLLSLPALLLSPPAGPSSKPHPVHLPSINLARHALRRCLALPALEPSEECRAWTGLAELGVLVLDHGSGEDEEDERGRTMTEVETALTKALLISQKHPSLALYTPHLTILSARLAQQHQANPKFAANALRLLLGSSRAQATPPHVLFTAHLALVHSYACAAEDEAPAGTTEKGGKGGGGGGALKKCFVALEDMRARAVALSTHQAPVPAPVPATDSPNLIFLLTLIIHLQLLVRHGQWGDVGQALGEAEAVCGLEFDDAELSAKPSTPTQGAPSAASAPPVPSPAQANSSCLSACLAHTRLRIHLLVLGVLFHTYAGDAREAARRLAVLHAVLDAEGCLEFSEGAGGGGNSGVEHREWEREVEMRAREQAREDFYEGIIEIPFPALHCRPLRIYATPPRVLHALAFLVSAAAKKDALGRAPKKAVFAKAGLAELAAVLGTLGGEGAVGARPVWSFSAGTREHTRVRLRMERIRADLLAEVVAISTLRSEFTPAQSTLDDLVAHTRTHGLFHVYAARIALMHAQLAHARGDAERALRCYRVAGWVASGGGDEGAEAERDEWVRVAARAGEVWIRIGILRRGASESGDPDENADLHERGSGEEERQRTQRDREMEHLRRFGKEVLGECEGLGGTLMVVGEVLKACLSEEFLAAKLHLRRALDLATRAQDNHLRALVLALVASYYHHTARDHAMTMLGTCGQLAAGLGAVAKKGAAASDTGTPTPTGAGKQGEAGKGVGNAPLRLWVGERVVELHRWAGEAQLAERQERVNRRLREVVAKFSFS